jgi:hypothetical protein
MQCEGMVPVARDVLIQHILRACDRYFVGNSSRLQALPVAELPFPVVAGPLKLIDVVLPDWGAHWGCDGVLAVPVECCADPAAPHWERVDWWLAAFLLLEGWHEQVWELQHGPIHSYAFRLHGWDDRAWDRAWVNRITLFLRAWTAHRADTKEVTLFGPLPRAELLLTHDVDAVTKTWAIRLKQSAFLGINTLRLLMRGKLGEAGARLILALRFIFLRSDWWTLDEMLEMERRVGLRSQFNFYADDRSKSLSRWLFDPGYDVTLPRLATLLKSLVRDGWRVGLHQSYDAWKAPALMRQQKERLQSLLPVSVSSCRQHWLRFSWKKTWRAQAEAGFRQDTTLMFNDRPGFRVSAALEWTPWNLVQEQGDSFKALPTVLMDSHFYDYQPMNADERRVALKHWLSEVVAVGGQAAVLWHSHTISADYGWRESFQDLLKELSEVSSC